MDTTAAVRKIRGEKGTKVILTVRGEDDADSRDISVTRDVINVPIITTEQRSDGIFLIEVAEFTANAPDLFRKALREFIESGGGGAHPDPPPPPPLPPGAAVRKCGGRAPAPPSRGRGAPGGGGGGGGGRRPPPRL